MVRATRLVVSLTLVIALSAVAFSGGAVACEGTDVNYDAEETGDDPSLSGTQADGGGDLEEGTVYTDLRLEYDGPYSGFAEVCYNN